MNKTGAFNSSAEGKDAEGVEMDSRERL